MKSITFVLLFIFGSVFCYSQDTITVVRLKWSNSEDPFMKSFYRQNDTIFEKRGQTSNQDMNEFIRLTHKKNFFQFYDHQGRIMLGTFWSGESIYGRTTFYWKNGMIKKEGEIIESGKTGVWVFYDRKGQLKRKKTFPSTF